MIGFPTSAPYEARNTNARPVLIDLQTPHRSQTEKRRQAIREHRNGDRKPVSLGATLSVVTA